MAYYPDNYDLEDDADSITLQELEPMTSSPYVRISLDPSPDSSANAERDQRRRQRELERQRDAERQKKAAKKRRAAEAQRPKAPEPSLHVIIERAPEEPSRYDGYGDRSYERYDSAPLPESTAVSPSRSQDRSAGAGRDRETPSTDFGRRQNDYPRTPDGRMYRVDEPEPSAPSSVVLPNGGWNADRARSAQYPGMTSADRAPYDTFRSQANSGDIPMYFEQQPARGERHPKIEPLGASSAGVAGQGIIKRPWSESAFNDHAAVAAASPAPQASGSPTPPTQPSKPTTPTITISGLSGAPSGVHDRTGMERRPFGAPEDPYANPRGMGSWKRNAAEAVRREQSANPRMMQPSTVSISMPAPSSGPASGPRDAGNIHLSRESLSSMGVTLPPQRQSSIRPYGAPLIEEGALKESAIFEEPPVSIADGMKDADSKRKRRRTLIIVIVAVLLAAVAACGALAYTGVIDLGSILPSSASQSSFGASGSGSAGTSTSGGTSTGNSRGSSAADQSGTVIYEYTATTSDGVAYNINDTVTYDAEGKCQTTTMKVEFPDEASCNEFLANLERDYGSSYHLDAQSGATATVTIDISSLKFNREQYEDALRYSVEELTVLKK